VPRDLARAARHFQAAAEEGVAKAQLFLGRMYAMGEGVKKDPVTAYFWLTLAATEEQEAAQVYLSDLERSLSSAQIEQANSRVKAFRPK